MGKMIFISGGARSGKSTFAEKLFTDEENVLYVATAIAFDDEMKDRIKRHKDRRNSSWETLEEYKNFDQRLLPKLENKNSILFDCITVMVTNIMVVDNDCDWDNISIEISNEIEEKVFSEVDTLLEILKKFDGTSVLVSNELGMGVVPDNPLGRIFRDIAGRVNQKIAQAADEAYFLVSGIPIKIKE